ncbi:hypothetical protein ACFLSA_06190, partial [Bacteroidota bacterium]
MGWEEVLLHLVPTWHINGTQHPVLKWPDKQTFSKNIDKWVPGFSKKVPSIIKKGAKLPVKTETDIQPIISNE